MADSAMEEVGNLLAGDMGASPEPEGEELSAEEGPDQAALKRDAATAFLGALEAKDADGVVATLSALMELVSLGSMPEEA